MRVLADECCDGSLVKALRADGHDVLYAAEWMAGLSDEDVLAQAFSQGRLVLTEDRDFGELVHRLKLPAHGVVYLRFTVEDRSAKVRRLRWLLGELGGPPSRDVRRSRRRPGALASSRAAGVSQDGLPPRRLLPPPPRWRRPPAGRRRAVALDCDAPPRQL